MRSTAETWFILTKLVGELLYTACAEVAGLTSFVLTNSHIVLHCTRRIGYSSFGAVSDSVVLQSAMARIVAILTPSHVVTRIQSLVTISVSQRGLCNAAYGCTSSNVNTKKVLQYIRGFYEHIRSV